jgi:hypothetical protein
LLFEYGGDPRVVNLNDRSVQWVLKHEIAKREATIAEQGSGSSASTTDESNELFGFQESLRLVRAWIPDRFYCMYGEGFKRWESNEAAVGDEFRGCDSTWEERAEASRMYAIVPL